MAPLFRIEMPGDVPLPCLNLDPDGTPRQPDSIRYFDLKSAAAVSGISEETLIRSFYGFLRDEGALAEVDVAPDRESLTDPSSEPLADGDLGVYVRSGENLASDSESLDAEAEKRRIRQRMAGITGDLYTEFEKQMNELGYDILRRECYPVLQHNEDTKRDEVVCCATLAAVEEKMLSSGLCDGWEQTMYAGSDGEFKTLWTEVDPPFYAQATLWRKGVRRPCIEVVKWDQVAQYAGEGKKRHLTKYWRERPLSALEKCAKMKAMRTLFRDYVGTVYAREELSVMSRRHNSQIVEQSTTLSGLRNRVLPNLGSSSGGEPDSATIAVDTVRTEADARCIMRSRGLVQDFMIDKVIAKAREERGEVEDMDPEAFWNYVLEQAARRFGMRR